MYLVRSTAFGSGHYALSCLSNAAKCNHMSLLLQLRQASCLHCSGTRCQDPACHALFVRLTKVWTVDRWVTRRRDKVQCEVEQSGAVHLVTCIKTERWQDMLIQRYNRRCAWLQAITGAVKEVHVLFTHYFTPSLKHSHMHLCFVSVPKNFFSFIIHR